MQPFAEITGDTLEILRDQSDINKDLFGLYENWQVMKRLDEHDNLNNEADNEDNCGNKCEANIDSDKPLKWWYDQWKH